ncbi:MAG: hypothetical protein OYH77_03205 [Pseudomonadota bacterium]|nr:hypothetical protein [Pseudomonadota bacterium]
MSWAKEFKKQPRKHLAGVVLTMVSATLMLAWFEVAQEWKELQARTEALNRFEQELADDFKNVTCLPSYKNDGGKGI